MEELLDVATGGAIWGIGFGAAMVAVRAVNGGLRRTVKTTVRGGMATRDWFRDATRGTRDTVRDIYREAKAEQEGRSGGRQAAVRKRQPRGKSAK